MELSYQSGIPLLNSLMSRTSISQSLAINGFVSNPLSNSTFLNTLKDKKILVVINAPSSSSDLFKKHSDSLSSFNRFSLWELDINHLIKLKSKNPEAKVEAETEAISKVISSRWKNNSSDLEVELKKEANFYSIESHKSLDTNKTYVCEIETFATPWIFGFPVLLVREIDEQGSWLEEHYFNINSPAPTNDKYWLKQTIEFKPKQNNATFDILLSDSKLLLRNYKFYEKAEATID